MGQCQGSKHGVPNCGSHLPQIPNNPGSRAPILASLLAFFEDLKIVVRIPPQMSLQREPSEVPWAQRRSWVAGLVVWMSREARLRVKPLLPSLIKPQAAPPFMLDTVGEAWIRPRSASCNSPQDWSSILNPSLSPLVH